MPRKNARVKPIAPSPNEQLKELVSTKPTKGEKKRKVDPNALIKSTQDISTFTIDKKKGVRDILTMFPDIEMAVDALVAGILSPKDLYTDSMTIDSVTKLLPTDVVNALNTLLEEETENEYDIVTNLNNDVKEALALNGSVVEVYLSNNSLVELLKSEKDNLYTIENFKARMLDRNTFTFTTENFEGLSSTSKLKTLDSEYSSLIKATVEHVDIITDTNILRLPELEAEDFMATEGLSVTVEKQKKKDLFFGMMQGDTTLTDTKNEPIIGMPTNKETEHSTGKKNTQRPLVMRIPSEAFIPIHNKSDKSKLLGGFIVLDEDGYPVTEKIKSNNGNSGIMQIIATSAIDKAKQGMAGQAEKAPELKNLEKINEEIISEEIGKLILDKRIATAADGDTINFIFQVLLNRHLKNKKTKLLFVKPQNVSFFVYNYRNNGTGEPLLEKMGYIASMRAIVMMARLKATVNNAVPNVNINIEMDPDDQFSDEHLQAIIAGIMQTHQSKLPIGLRTMPDFIDWAQRMGYHFTIDHPDIPKYTITSEQSTTQYDVPDESLEKTFSDQMYRVLLMPPELMENYRSPEFASQFIATDTLHARRLAKLQNKTEYNLWKKINVIVLNDGVIRTKMTEAIRVSLKGIKKYLKDKSPGFEASKISDDDLIEILMDDYMLKMMPRLPRPEVLEEGGLLESFKSYKDAVEEYIEIFLGDESTPSDLMKNMDVDIDTLKAAIMNTVLRKWMKRNNFMPELLELFTQDELGSISNNALLEFNSYVENIDKAIAEYLKVKEGKNEPKQDDDTTPPNNDGDTPPDDTGDGDTPPEEK